MESAGRRQEQAITSVKADVDTTIKGQLVTLRTQVGDLGKNIEGQLASVRKEVDTRCQTNERKMSPLENKSKATTEGLAEVRKTLDSFQTSINLSFPEMEDNVKVFQMEEGLKFVLGNPRS